MYFKQIKEIVTGEKTCTQRIVKPGETFHTARDGAISLVFDAKGRVKWRFGGKYKVSPGRGHLSAMVQWDWQGVAIDTVSPFDKAERSYYELRAYDPLRIRLLRIEQVQLQSMDEAVAKAEGVQSVEDYIALWRTINGKHGVRWEDNPLVWRLWFEVVKHETQQRVGRRIS